MIYNEDCLQFCHKQADNSFDIILADPPYNIGKNFGNKSDKQKFTNYIEWSSEWLQEFERIIKSSGTIYIYGFSEILAHISVLTKSEVRWLIWHYTNKNTPGSKFWNRSHESILCISKNSKDRIFNLDDVREDYSEIFLKNSAGKIRKNTKGRFGDQETVYKANANGALPRDVIKIPALAGGAGMSERIIWCDDCDDVFLGKHECKNIESHPTQKPIKLTEKLLKACLNKDRETKLYIPFGGSGSECLTAEKMKLNWEATEINKKYVARTEKLINKYK